MNPILALLMVVVGTALAESGQHSSNIQQQYADAMDTFANREAVSSSSGWDSSTTYSYPSEY
jgi:hypothetical protein